MKEISMKTFKFSTLACSMLVSLALVSSNLVASDKIDDWEPEVTQPQMPAPTAPSRAPSSTTKIAGYNRDTNGDNGRDTAYVGVEGRYKDDAASAIIARSRGWSSGGSGSRVDFTINWKHNFRAMVKELLLEELGL